MVLVAVVLLGGGVDALVTGGVNMAYAARWQGTPGRLTVLLCTEEGFGKTRHTRCEGTFRSDDGKVVDRDAGMSQSLSPGSTLPVQRKASGGYDRVGFAAFSGWLAVAFLGLAMAGTAVLGVSSATARAAFRPAWLTVGGLLAAALLTALVSAVGGAFP
ncbi:hypothetical protein [Actinacidiphila acidipaludis]|uniref:Uncharacterized protein n=1 Tax=Actinacidiphila acidipaludis TaxID=2873382 RepID=A0ABS7Q3A0_9ACTN|nr:hypothetical protein [Streptomyces acidipaludis]MBY8877612.1 hypothetical protein [Streptomyces acidipaludis]